jgi:hypothetical protein
MRQTLFSRDCPRWIPTLGILFFILHLSASAVAGPFDLPPLERDDQKLAFLLEVKKQVPALFSDAAQYDIDLFKLLDNEQELVELLKKYPAYKTLFEQKRYVDLIVTPPQGGILVGAVEIKPEAVQLWKDRLLAQIQKLKGHPAQAPIDLKAKIVELQRAVHFSTDPNQLIPKIGRVEQMGKSREEKDAFYAKVAAFKDRNDVLLGCKQRKTLLAKYECIQESHAKLGGLPHLPSAMELTALIEVLKAEEKLHPMLELFAVMNRFPEAQIPSTWEALAEKVNHLNAQDLIHLDDRDDALKPILKQVMAMPLSGASASAPSAPAHESIATLRAVEAVHKIIRSFAAQTSAQQTKVTGSVKITEVQPEIGIFRGCAGGDCASQYSFPYPNDPHERVFFIEEAAEVESHSSGAPTKKLRGYVSATEVKLANGEKALYVITISGNKVSPGSADLILRGLEKEKAKLGVKHIILPTSENVASLINYPGIRGVYDSYTKRGKPEAISYQDLHIRQAIEEFKPETDYNSGTYDNHTRNQMGIVFKPDHQSDHLVTQVVQQKLKVISPPAVAQESPQELLEFILDLHHSQRDELKDKVLQIESVKKLFDPKLFDSLITLLETCAETKSISPTVQHFKESLQSLLKAFGVSEDFINMHPKYLYPGILECSDAYSKDHINETAEGIARDFKQNNYEQTTSVNLLALTPERRRMLDATPAMQKIYNKLLLHLKSPDIHIRTVAAQTLGQLSPSDVKINLALADALQDVAPGVKIAAAYALDQIQPTEEKVNLALIRAVTSAESDIDLRLTAIQALRRIKPRDVKTYQALAGGLKDPNRLVRIATAEALNAIARSISTKHQREVVRCLQGADTTPFNEEKIQELQKIMEQI